jgi:hypothetical protein
MSDRMITNYAAEWELANSRRILAEAEAHLAPREGETDEQFQKRHDDWLKAQAEALTRPVANKPPVRADNPTDLYNESAREQLLADIRDGKAKPPTHDEGPVSLADPALYSDDARAKLIAEARATADRAAKTNTPRG